MKKTQNSQDKSKWKKQEENKNTVAGMRRILIDAGVVGASRFNKERCLIEIQKLEEKNKEKETLVVRSIFIEVEKSKKKKDTYNDYYNLVKSFEKKLSNFYKVQALPKFAFPTVSKFVFFGYFTDDKRQIFYDSFPFDYIISSDNNNFVGINFHYLRPSFRWRAIELVLGGYAKELPRKCFHQYRYDRLTTPTYVCPLQYVRTACLLGNEAFKLIQGQTKLDSKKVWSL